MPKKKRKKPDPNVRRPSLRKNEETGKWEFVFSKADKGKICRVAFCTRERRKEKRKIGGIVRLHLHPVCNTCGSRRWRANNPEKNAFKELRHSAKRRDIHFSLTLLQFLKIIEGTDYLTKSGTFRGSLTIDRIQDRVGYEFGNCQVLTNEENVAKGNRSRRAIEDPDDNIPF